MWPCADCVAVEVALQRVAERDDPEELARRRAACPCGPDRGPRPCGAARPGRRRRRCPGPSPAPGGRGSGSTCPQPSAISLRPMLVIWSTFLPNSGELASSAISSATKPSTLRRRSADFFSSSTGTSPAACSGATTGTGSGGVSSSSSATAVFACRRHCPLMLHPPAIALRILGRAAQITSERLVTPDRYAWSPKPCVRSPRCEGRHCPIATEMHANLRRTASKSIELNLAFHD